MTDETRHHVERSLTLRPMGPLAQDHPLVMSDARCPACGASFLAGDLVTMIALGPGGSPEAQERARAGRAYNAAAVPVHWPCATGRDT